MAMASGTPVGPNCLIQSNLAGGNLEAVLFANGQLHHMFRHGTVWQAGQTLPSPASGPGSMIQSDFGSGDHKNFEVVLWNGTDLVHFWHDNSDVSLPWQRGQTITTKATGPGSIIQSTFGSGKHKNFEVVVLEKNELVHYWHDNSDVNLPWRRGQTITSKATGPGCIIQSDFGNGNSHKNFEVVVLEGNSLQHLWHDNSDVNLPWQRGQTITTKATGPGSIILSIFGDVHKNFEVVVLEENELVHYWHDNSNVNLAWQKGQVVSVASTGPGCIAKAFIELGHESFQVLTAELTRSVVNYWHHNIDVTLPWWRLGAMPNFAEVGVDSPNVHSTIKISQLTGEFDNQMHMPTLSQTKSRFGVVGCDLGQSFEHEGRVYFLFGDTNVDDNIRKNPPSKESLDTIGFTSDTDASHGIRIDLNRNYPYVEGINQGAFCVPADGVSINPGSSGPGWAIQSNFGSTSHKNFEVVVLQGNELIHWWHDNSDVNLLWQVGQTISTTATGPGCIIQSDFGSTKYKNFEVVVLEGSNLVHYWHDNSNASLPWQRGQIITSKATGPGCIIQSNFGSSSTHKNFEVIVLEGSNLAHWWHDNSNVNLPWQRGQIITSKATGPGCIIQSDFGSGSHENFEVVVLEANNLVHYWHDNSNVNLPWQRGQIITSKATGSGCILQSDFGTGNHKNFEVVVPEGNSLAHWWHNNSDVNLPWQRGQIITTNANGAGCIIESDFRGGSHRNFEVIVPEGNDLKHWWHNNSDVNLPWQRGGTITRTLMYVFFTTDAREDANFGATMGRSVLARSGDGGLNFGTPLYELSRLKFINVSLHVVDNKDFPGLPEAAGKGLLVWGSGGYRRSNVYLAYIAVNKIGNRAALTFFAGIVRNKPVWTKQESDAKPLFLSGSVGEFCIRWNQFLHRFILLYNGDNPGAIIEHQSLTPWGPWTSGENIFDAPAAFGHYIHIANSSDGLSDPGRDSEGGGTYGPYMIDRYSKPNDDGSCDVFFVLSVWNPYNTMLMKATLRQRK